MSIPTVESVLDHERYTMEKIAEKAHYCFDCSNCRTTESDEVSEYLSSKVSVGFCVDRYAFVSCMDTDDYWDCTQWRR